MSAEELGDIRPHATQQDVIRMAYELYGLKVLSIKKLNGYDDQNFHVMVDMSISENSYIDKLCDLGYVFKILNIEDSQNEGHLSAQIGMLNHVNAKGVVCPVHIKDKKGNFFTEQAILNKNKTASTKHLVRMLEYLAGDIAGNGEFTTELAFKGGLYMSELHVAMQGFDDKRLCKPGYLWNLSSVPALTQYLHAIEDPENKTICEQVIAKWISMKDEFDSLPDVPIHSDFNEQNLLVERHETGGLDIVGILDFQDSCYAKRSFDIAIFIAYMMIFYKEDKLSIGGYCLKGFLKKQSMTEVELRMVYYATAGRLVQTLIMGAYNYSIHQDPYLLVTQNGWPALRALWSKPADEVVKTWMSTPEL